MTLNPEDYKLTPEQQLSYDKLQGSFYHFHRQYPSLSYYGNIPAQYSENTVSWIQWMHWIEGWIKTINDNQNKLNDDFNDFVDQFNKFLDDLPNYVVGLIKEKFDEERPGMITEVTDGVEDKIKEDLIDPIQEEVNDITAQNDGINKMYQLLYKDGTFNRDSAATAEFLLAPKLTRNAVMQAINYDASLGQWFITQQDNLQPEGFVITRLDAGGNLLSNMWFKGMGHGSSMYIRTRPDNTPMVFVQNNTEYRKVPYTDNTTVTVDNTLHAYTPPYDGNGMTAYADGIMCHINNITEEHLLSVYEAKYDINDNNYIFPENGKHISLDVTSLIPTDVNSLQGLTILRKKDISGQEKDNGKYVIFIGGGNGGVQITMQPFEYDLEKNTLTKLDLISGLEDVVKPILNSDYIGWEGNYFELEGLTKISIDGSARGDGYVSTIAYGITAGIIGKRRQYIFSFQNTMISNYLSSARSAQYENAQTNFLSPDTTYLYNVTKPGQYNLLPNNTISLLDFPNNWVGMTDNAEWNLFVGKPNQNGDFVQILYRRFYGSASEIYTRSINYTAGQYGENYVPTTIGPWALIKSESQYAHILTTAAGSKFNRLSAFSIPGSNYYVSVTTNNAYITDLEGLENELSNRAFSIETMPSGGLGDQLQQTITYNKNGTFIIAKRTITASPSTYGPSMTTLPQKGGWTIFTGGQSNTDTWTTFNGSGSAKLSYKIKNGLVELKAYSIKTGNTGIGNPGGAIATLPDEIAPKEDVWGIIANMDSKPVSLTISARDKLLYISSLMSSTMTSTSVITLHVNYYV